MSTHTPTLNTAKCQLAQKRFEFCQAKTGFSEDSQTYRKAFDAYLEAISNLARAALESARQ